MVKLVVNNLIMQKPYLLLLLAICFSCSEKKETKSLVREPYFDFDEVVYYRLVNNQPDIFALDEKDILTAKDSATLELTGEYFLSSYTPDIAYLDSIGLKKIVVPVRYYNKLNEIFSVKKMPDNLYTTACDPIYRDIFVFKRKGKVSGMARICLECCLYSFKGSKYNTESFGYHRECNELRKLNQEL